MGFDYRTSTGLGKQLIASNRQNLVPTKTHGKGAVTPEETEPDLPVNVQESPVEIWVYSGLMIYRGTEFNHSESESYSAVSDSLQPCGLYSPWNSPGKNTRVGSLSLLQGTFPTGGLNPGLPHCSWILYKLSCKRSPRILEWVTYPFSSKSSVQFSHSVVSNSLCPHELQHARVPCSLPTPGACLNSCPFVMPSSHATLCHPFLPLPSIFPSIRVFPMSQLFASGGQSIGVSASVSILPVNIQN